MSKIRYWALGVVGSSLLTLGSCFSEPDGSSPGGRGGTAASNAGSGGTETGGSAVGGGPDSGGTDGGAAGSGEAPAGPKTVLVVMEGLRPELVSPELTPNLWRIAENGVRFSKVSSVVPSNRMAAAASLATGVVPGRHGVLGERMYLPGAAARDSLGRAVDTSQPVSLGDRGTLESLHENLAEGLLQSRSLVEVALDAGFGTAVIGRSGPASVFDLRRSGWGLDDSYVYPYAFARIVLELGKGMPSYGSALFPDLVAPSAYRTDDEFTRYGASIYPGQIPQYPGFLPVGKVQAFLNPLLPALHTFEAAEELESAAAGRLLSGNEVDLLVVWMRGAGETALRAGPGSVAEVAQVNKSLDRDLGALESALPEGSNLVLVSDGGTSALAGDPAFFPRWGLVPGNIPAARWAAVDTAGGISVDGAVRLVDLLNRGGFTAHDGQSCLSGLAYTTYPVLSIDDAWPFACRGTKGGELTGPAMVPEKLDPNAVVVVSNGASELLYLPSHRVSTLSRLVEFLQSRPEVGSVFVAPRYAKEGAAPAGTLDLGLLGFPPDTLLDVLVTYNWDAADGVAGAPLVQGGVVQTPALFDACPLGTDCRPGLYCDRGNPSFPVCKFCPPDQPVDQPMCNLAGTPEQREVAYAEAKAVSVYRKEGEACEQSGAVCAPGLRCVYSICRPPEAPWSLARAQPGAAAKGTSYGAMHGVGLLADGNLTDHHGVRGGSSPADLGSILIMSGPAFKTHTVVEVPSGIVDVAPTLLHVLRAGLEDELGMVDGRLLSEALADSSEEPTTFEALSTTSTTANRPFYAPTSPDSSAATLLSANGSYSSALEGFNVTRGDRTYVYYTSAGATRSPLGCTAATDCPAGIQCGGKGVCLITPSCVDGVKNGLEADVDCGNAAGCLPCAPGRSCAGPLDCDPTYACPALAAPDAVGGVPAEKRKCLPALCLDGIKSGYETDMDCGKAAGCFLCADGQACLSNDDCENALCENGACTQPQPPVPPTP
ncbi:MAG: hypothetical protein K0R38_3829 [Polyangiaceae bacterium]|jgi:hypothetical protein|nr:hypothetical protein [Polyangiaceae bacterium]